ncbi:amidase [Undibacterium sp.]|jgi:aspartyl-tRNA(Asn)/glutamyl-tRNA(Gln) amidotransferase subunit A|uniref:amidase n=1 Tax=Undibacterium sp. TaxID=1914977 RepID=UPI002C47E05A|nr:amidase [Undibacterium sp.]HTD05388.1 amidase [Undibacterium sp.]
MKTTNSLSISALNQHSRTKLLKTSLEAALQSKSVFTKLYPEAALAAAAYADSLQNAGVAPLSALAGLSVSIKDLLDVAGEPTLAGSMVLRDAPPATADAPVVSRLRRAGAAILGKTNMTEFAFSGIGLNPHYGTPANPADSGIARIPGGSSSGAAVSVAAGICVAGIGSDTGGSIRIPAALCGLTGFKPTARRVPTTGTLPLSTTLDTICAMSHTVRDCILVDQIIADDILDIRVRPLAGLKLAVPQTLVLDDLDSHVATSFARILSRLSAAGAHIVEVPMNILQEYRPLGMFSAAEAYAWHRHLLADREHEYDGRVSRRIKMGASLSAADYIELHTARKHWIQAMEVEFAPFDAVIMPTVPVVAPVMAELEASEDAFFAANALLLRNTAPINILDGCAISIPCHAEGSLPVGLSIAGVANSDKHILAVALAIETLLHP